MESFEKPLCSGARRIRFAVNQGFVLAVQIFCSDARVKIPPELKKARL